MVLKKKVNVHCHNIQPVTIWLDPMYCRPEKKTFPLKQTAAVRFKVFNLLRYIYG